MGLALSNDNKRLRPNRKHLTNTRFLEPGIHQRLSLQELIFRTRLALIFAILEIDCLKYQEAK
jgi:hypothetical protein